MKAYIKDNLRCGGCGEVLWYGDANDEGRVKCGNAHCKQFDIPYKIPTIELIKASVEVIDQGFIPETS